MNVMEQCSQITVPVSLLKFAYEHKGINRFRSSFFSWYFSLSSLVNNDIGDAAKADIRAALNKRSVNLNL